MSQADIRAEIEGFADELATRAPAQLEALLTGEKDVLQKQNIRQDPEQFVCQYLVWPLCRALNYDHVTEWYLDGHDGSADFCIQATTTPILGEVKRLNHYKRALGDLRDYLNHRTTDTAYGLVTDGFSWLLFRAPMDHRQKPTILRHFTVREAVFDYLVDNGHVRPQLEGSRVLRHSTIQPFVDSPYRRYGRLQRYSPATVAEGIVTRASPSALENVVEGRQHDQSLSQVYDPSDQADETTLSDFESE